MSRADRAAIYANVKVVDNVLIHLADEKQLALTPNEAQGAKVLLEQVGTLVHQNVLARAIGHDVHAVRDTMESLSEKLTQHFTKIEGITHVSGQYSLGIPDVKSTVGPPL